MADGPRSCRLVRYLLGMIGMVLIWYGLEEAVQIEAAGWVLDYTKSMLAGLWVTLGAPLMFIGLGLARREKVDVDGQKLGR